MEKNEQRENGWEKVSPNCLYMGVCVCICLYYIIELTRENVFKDSDENFDAIKIRGFCERFMMNLMIRMASTSHGKSKRAGFGFAATA